MEIAPGVLEVVQQMLDFQKADLTAKHAADERLAAFRHAADKRAAVAAARRLDYPAGSAEADDVVGRVWPTLGLTLGRQSDQLCDISERYGARLLSGALPAYAEPYLYADVLDDLADEVPHLMHQFGRVAGLLPHGSRLRKDWVRDLGLKERKRLAVQVTLHACSRRAANQKAMANHADLFAGILTGMGVGVSGKSSLRTLGLGETHTTFVKHRVTSSDEATTRQTILGGGGAMVADNTQKARRRKRAQGAADIPVKCAYNRWDPLMDPAEVSHFMSSVPRWVDPALLAADGNCKTYLVSDTRTTGCWTDPANALAVADPSLPPVHVVGAVYMTERQKLELHDVVNVAQMLEIAATAHHRKPWLMPGRASTNETFDLFYKHVDRYVRPSFYGDQAKQCNVRVDASKKPVRNRETVTTPAAVNTVAGMGQFLNQLASARSERRGLGLLTGGQPAPPRHKGLEVLDLVGRLSDILAAIDSDFDSFMLGPTHEEGSTVPSGTHEMLLQEAAAIADRLVADHPELAEPADPPAHRSPGFAFLDAIAALEGMADGPGLDADAELLADVIEAGNLDGVASIMAARRDQAVAPVVNTTARALVAKVHPRLGTVHPMSMPVPPDIEEAFYPYPQVCNLTGDERFLVLATKFMQRVRRQSTDAATSHKVSTVKKFIAEWHSISLQPGLFHFDGQCLDVFVQIYKRLGLEALVASTGRKKLDTSKTMDDYQGFWDVAAEAGEVVGALMFQRFFEWEGFPGVDALVDAKCNLRLTEFADSWWNFLNAVDSGDLQLKDPFDPAEFPPDVVEPNGKDVDPDIFYTLDRFVWVRKKKRGQKTVTEYRVRWKNFGAADDMILERKAMLKPNGTLTSKQIDAEVESMTALHGTDPSLAAIDLGLPDPAPYLPSAPSSGTLSARAKESAEQSAPAPGRTLGSWVCDGTAWMWMCCCGARFKVPLGQSRPGHRAPKHVQDKHSGDAELTAQLEAGVPAGAVAAAPPDAAGNIAKNVTMQTWAVQLPDICASLRQAKLTRRASDHQYARCRIRHFIGYFASVRKYNYFNLSLKIIEDHDIAASETDRLLNNIQLWVALADQLQDRDGVCEAYNKEVKSICGDAEDALERWGTIASQIATLRQLWDRTGGTSAVTRQSRGLPRDEQKWCMFRALGLAGVVGVNRSAPLSPSLVENATRLSARTAAASCLPGCTVTNVRTGRSGQVTRVEMVDGAADRLVVEIEQHINDAATCSWVQLRDLDMSVALAEAKVGLAPHVASITALLEEEQVLTATSAAQDIAAASVAPEHLAGAATGTDNSGDADNSVGHVELDGLDVPPPPDAAFAVARVYDEYPVHVRRAMTGSLPRSFAAGNLTPDKPAHANVSGSLFTDEDVKTVAKNGRDDTTADENSDPSRRVRASKFTGAVGQKSIYRARLNGEQLMLDGDVNEKRAELHRAMHQELDTLQAVFAKLEAVWAKAGDAEAADPLSESWEPVRLGKEEGEFGVLSSLLEQAELVADRIADGEASPADETAAKELELEIVRMMTGLTPTGLAEYCSDDDLSSPCDCSSDDCSSDDDDAGVEEGEVEPTCMSPSSVYRLIGWDN